MVNSLNVIKIDNKTEEIIELFSFNTHSRDVISAEDKFLELIKNNIDEPIEKNLIIDIIEDGFFKTPNFNIHLKYSTN